MPRPLGSKFHGKRVFTLVRLSDGEEFYVFGKRVTPNSRVYDGHGQLS